MFIRVLRINHFLAVSYDSFNVETRKKSESSEMIGDALTTEKFGVIETMISISSFF